MSFNVYKFTLTVWEFSICAEKNRQYDWILAQKKVRILLDPTKTQGQAKGKIGLK